jgi:hypothetical protein
VDEFDRLKKLNEDILRGQGGSESATQTKPVEQSKKKKQ